MIRTLATVALVMIVQSRPHAEPKLRLLDIDCLTDGTLVGRNEDLRAVISRESGWQPLALPGRVSAPWRSPSGRVFVVEGDNPTTIAELLGGSGTVPRWVLPRAEGRHLRFASLDGIDVVTADRVYRLDPAGKFTMLGETPIGGSRRPLPRAPELLAANGTTVVCTGTWVHHDDSVGGSCREANGAYTYLVDFGEPFCCTDDVDSFTAPFVCGDAVISAVRDKTQARALATGALLGRTAGAARQGSTCLDGKRALLVGKRDIQIVSVPRLRRLWREKDSTEIQSVAVCHGGTRAIILRKGMAYPVEEFDLASPAAFGKKEEDDGRMSRGP